MRVEHRRLDWPDCRNARDLGGLPTTDGRRIRQGALIRTDDPRRLTEAGVATVRAYGVSRVIDLRTEAERTARPSPFLDDPVYLAAPFIDEVADLRRDPVAETSLLATYLAGMARNGRTIVAALAAIADAPPGGVLVHCHAGKDRTGILVALALRLADVPVEVVVADFVLTEECLREHHRRQLARITDPAAREVLRDRQGSPAESIIAVLDLLDREYGGVAGYLRTHGFDAARVAALRRRLRDE